MSTIYNPLTSDSFLSEFSQVGKGVTDNSIAQESAAPSSLNFSLGAVGDALAGGVMPPSGYANSLFGLKTSPLSISRIVAIVLGLLLIAGGIIMFRPETVNDVATAAAA